MKKNQKKYNILYLDDEVHNLRTFKATFKWEFEIFTARSAFEGFDVLEQNDIHLIISDQRMAGLSGTEFLKRIKVRYPDTLRIILTGYTDLDVVVRAINDCGIHRFITKPWKELQMKNVLDHALEFYQLRKDKKSLVNQLEVANQRLKAENIYLKEELNQNYDFQNIITNSDQFKATLQVVERVASTNTTVLVRGETGTGKELLARAIHSLSKRKDEPLVKVNCAALHGNLIESELFGHEKGAYTGANQKRIGRFELANNATIFLDEIGELSIDLQAKLLRVLQDGEFERLGGNETLKINVRVIAATNRNLEKAITAGVFREDLFFRLNVFPVTSPPLRERKEDIPALVDHFLKKYRTNIGREISIVPEVTMKKLVTYDYPGNIRELENLVERFMITSPEDRLEILDWNPTVLIRAGQDQDDKFLSMEQMEIKHITDACIRSHWKVFGSDGAAKILNMNPKTLFSRMTKLGIKKPVTT